MVVGKLQECRIDLHLACKHGAHSFFGRLPRRNIFGPRRQLAVRWDHSELLLPGKGLVAYLVPALVEVALVLCDPVLWCVMRRMAGAGCEVNEERLFRGDRLLLTDPSDRLVPPVFHHMISLLPRAFQLGL